MQAPYFCLFLAWLSTPRLHGQLPLPKMLKVTLMLLSVLVNWTKGQKALPQLAVS